MHRAALAYLHQGGVAAAGLASHPDLLNSLFASAADLHDLGLTVLCKMSVYDVARAKFGFASISLSEQADFLDRARKQVCDTYSLSLSQPTVAERQTQLSKTVNPSLIVYSSGMHIFEGTSTKVPKM